MFIHIHICTGGMVALFLTSVLCTFLVYTDFVFVRNVPLVHVHVYVALHKNTIGFFYDSTLINVISINRQLKGGN